MNTTKIIFTCEFCEKEFAREVDHEVISNGNEISVVIVPKEHDNEGPLCDNCLK